MLQRFEENNWWLQYSGPILYRDEPNLCHGGLRLLQQTGRIINCQMSFEKHDPPPSKLDFQASLDVNGLTPDMWAKTLLAFALFPLNGHNGFWNMVLVLSCSKSMPLHHKLAVWASLKLGETHDLGARFVLSPYREGRPIIFFYLLLLLFLIFGAVCFSNYRHSLHQICGSTQRVEWVDLCTESHNNMLRRNFDVPHLEFLYLLNELMNFVLFKFLFFQVFGFCSFSRCSPKQAPIVYWLIDATLIGNSFDDFFLIRSS